ncbi:hypothetical protein B484DRAFT_452833 [Ochromonadaceae sp. CCMP2298]|nr:hypothetical protein B484DRAFT_452833 [Ochromonadaceae sp. CCMP2298]
MAAERTSPAIPPAQKDNSISLPESPDLSFQLKSPGTPEAGSNLLRSANLDMSRDESEENEEGEEGEAGHLESPGPIEETVEQRRQREDRESEALAWELMQQENQEVYNMQLQFMQENAGTLSEEDLAVMQQLMNEAGRQEPEEEEEGEEGGEGEELDDSDASNWSYDRLLTLGHRLGDVKTDRWRIRADEVIKALPRKLYRDIVPEAIVRKAEITNEVLPLPPAPMTEPTTAVKASQSQCEEQSSSNKKRCIRSDEAILSCAKQIEGDRCVVCMDDFEPTDEVVMLPCDHFHHIPCTEGWLADHDFCPCCKAPVSATP